MTRNFGRGIRSVMPRRLLLPVLVASALLSACPGEPPPEPADAGFSPFVLPTSADERSNVFPLIGRWYPVDEVKRLSDRTLTPEVWCERDLHSTRSQGWKQYAAAGASVWSDGLAVVMTCGSGVVHDASLGPPVRWCGEGPHLFGTSAPEGLFATTLAAMGGQREAA